ncbi:c-5 sterol desaturase [Ceratocystis pirilliformis]|uniref:C-5 sterol desaturase n=1 Tax=Ceratocystis pirilliformis TaxID=259994 RepID=A0ABR3Z523_9PEZI
MDIILQVIDTYVADHIYAWAVPARITSHGGVPGSHNSSASFSNWKYEPATSYLYMEPSPSAYLSEWNREHTLRQAITLFFITWIFGVLLYFIFATLSYCFIFDKRTFDHPRFLKNQMSLEIKQANQSLPLMAVLTIPFFVCEVKGWGKLYDTLDQAPAWWYNWLQFPLFLVFTDFWIYWIHRGLHHPRIYKHLHKPHHKWIMPTPFASHAFHPVDGWAQSLPYHIFPFVFPLQKVAYVILFAFVNFWTIMIHDGEYLTDNPVVNGAACHSLHHSKFEVNYGQFFTFLDRLGGTYRRPEAYMFEKELKMSKKTFQKETQEVDDVVKEVEGGDDRSYGAEDKKTK